MRMRPHRSLLRVFAVVLETHSFVLSSIFYKTRQVPRHLIETLVLKLS